MIRRAGQLGPTFSGSLAEDTASAEAAERPSFDELYEGHFDFVWRVARRLGARVGTDDVVQEVFLTVCRQLPAFEGRSSVKTWIFGITRRVVATHRRTRRRQEEGLDRLSVQREEAMPLDPEAAAQRHEAARILEEILESLDDTKREVFVLAELEHLPIAEVALILEINVHTAQWRLKAARRAVEQALERLQARQRRESR